MNIKSSLILFLYLFILQSIYCNEDISDGLRAVVSQIQNSEKTSVGDEFIFSPTSLASFYSNREMKSVWIGEDGFTLNGQIAINIIAKAESDGLDPKDYHFSKIISLKKLIGVNIDSSYEINQRKVHLELLITDGLLLYLSHINLGKLNPKSFQPEWTAQRERANFIYHEFLEKSINNNSLEESINSLSPGQVRYQDLKQALLDYKEMNNAGGWEEIVAGTRLELDSLNERVTQLKIRLRSEGYVLSDTTEQELFDKELQSVVKVYQSNNGLASDGVVGPATIRSLNIKLEDKIQQIKINLERWRWYEKDLKVDHLRVNITNFNLEVVKENKIVFECRAIVGKTSRETPEFNGELSYIVFNPYWRVPSGILVNDIIPAAKKDSSYLDKKRIRVLKAGAIVDSKSIDWKTENIWKYTYRQDPGKLNSMGLIKFMFPNSHNVYIHDTPTKNLFESTQRTFSSGCIRIEKPALLAEYLLRNMKDWDLDKIMQTLDNGDPSISVDLEKKMPVRILYYTAWSEKNVMQFRKDIYKKDAAIIKGLSASAQKP